MSDRKPNAAQSHFSEGKVQIQRGIVESRHENGKIKCLGIPFASKEDRQAYFLEELRKNLQNLESRNVPGFPKGEVGAILQLSNPPYFTACPNPFIRNFLEHLPRADSNNEDFTKVPLTADISEGKNDPLYQAHSYHTKVPYKAIQHYIEHFTKAGDLVGDFFCGTGMTALAAISKGRNAIVGDLSPYATFIAHHYLYPPDFDKLRVAISRVVRAAENEVGWAYKYELKQKKVELQSVVWSDHYFCPNCSKELIFWNIAVKEDLSLREELQCTDCHSYVEKGALIQVRTASGEVKRSPVLMFEKCGGKRNSRSPEEEDLNILQKCEAALESYSYPMEKLMFIGQRFGDMYVPRQHKGVSTVNEFYLPRSLLAAACIYKHINRETDRDTKSFLMWGFLSIQNYINKKQSYFGGGGGQPGTLTIADILQEKNVLQVFERKMNKLLKLEEIFKQINSAEYGRFLITTQSATDLASIPENVVDYIFTDPPFGRNLMYSELNFINEAWLQVFTNNDQEAIVNRSQQKDRQEYFKLMSNSFREYYRILKPGRWITVEFHNSASVIWNGIQEALGSAGFIIAQVAILDKQEKTFKQLESATGAVEKDLVISAYKPTEGVEKAFALQAGTEQGAWEFVQAHLSRAPLFFSRGNQISIVAERQKALLFDRMVAFHIQRGVHVPLSAGQFYEGLVQRFVERDGMYFLPEQVAEYDRKRREVKELVQLQIIVTDESSAINWLRQEIMRKPQTFQELHPEFIKETAGWQKYEKPVELIEMLRGNFVQYEGEGEVPAPIHAYLSSNYHELRSLAKDNPQLQEKAKGRWYVPDPRKASDLERIRERELLREFAAITSAKGRVKQLRTEAARAGFKALWEQGDYKAIVEVAGKIPSNIVEEDSHLLMYVDLARSRLG